MREKRLNEIMKILKEKGYLSIKDIQGMFGVSEITARRDLAFLESQGLIERKRGGAFLKSFKIEMPFFFKLNENKEKKLRVARKAVELLENGQVVAVSGGTTTYYTIQALDESPIHDLTIVTHSITTAWAVINLRKHFNLINSGGSTRENSFECIGSYTLKFFQGMNFDVFLMGVDGIDVRKGVMFSSFEEAMVARTIVENSSKVIVVADDSKIGLKTPYVVCEASKVDYLVTTPHPDLPKFEKIGINIVLA